ncbi:MAG: hypothetical protein MUP21_02050 [Dehalococcoidia bacterium]|nr:hypothetical protein [Dehalococcoidia bacterium]
MSAFFGQQKDLTFQLLLGATPVDDVLYSDVTLDIRKNGDPAFANRVLLTEEWVNLGGGYYALRFLADDYDRLGDFRYRLIGLAFDTLSGSFDIDPAPISYLAQAPSCIVSGNIVDIGGVGMRLQPITFRPRFVPALSGLSLIASGLIQTGTDAVGNFSVALIRGSKVLVEIQAAAIRYEITIPDASSANLLDLLPPFPPAP